jgi:hypothetical protein
MPHFGLKKALSTSQIFKGIYTAHFIIRHLYVVANAASTIYDINQIGQKNLVFDKIVIPFFLFDIYD